MHVSCLHLPQISTHTVHLFFVVVFVYCYFMHEKVLVFSSVLGWLFLFLLLSPVFVLIAFLHANYRMSWKWESSEKKGKIMLSSNCLLFVRKCVKYMTWKYFQNSLWLSFWCIFLLLSKGVGIFPIGKYDEFINNLLLIQVVGMNEFSLAIPL